MPTHVRLSAGMGPAECQWAVARLVTCFLDEAAAHGLAPRVLETIPGEARGTSRSVLIALEADGPAGWLESWNGTIKWVGLSPYRPQHKRRNWFIGVAASGGAGTPPDPALDRDRPVRVYEGKHFHRRQ
jgi:peptide chain release factor